MKFLTTSIPNQCDQSYDHNASWCLKLPFDFKQKWMHYHEKLRVQVCVFLTRWNSRNFRFSRARCRGGGGGGGIGGSSNGLRKCRRRFVVIKYNLLYCPCATSSLLRWSCHFRYLIVHQLLLSMEHHKRISINSQFVLSEDWCEKLTLSTRARHDLDSNLGCHQRPTLYRYPCNPLDLIAMGKNRMATYKTNLINKSHCDRTRSMTCFAFYK